MSSRWIGHQGGGAEPLLLYIETMGVGGRRDGRKEVRQVPHMGAGPHLSPPSVPQCQDREKVRGGARDRTQLMGAAWR